MLSVASIAYARLDALGADLADLEKRCNTPTSSLDVGAGVKVGIMSAKKSTSLEFEFILNLRSSSDLMSRSAPRSSRTRGGPVRAARVLLVVVVVSDFEAHALGGGKLDPTPNSVECDLTG